MNRRAWKTAVHGGHRSRTQLKRLNHHIWNYVLDFSRFLWISTEALLWTAARACRILTSQPLFPNQCDQGGCAKSIVVTRDAEKDVCEVLSPGQASRKHLAGRLCRTGNVMTSRSFSFQGESGLGKSTLINSLFLTDLYPERVIPGAAGTEIPPQQTARCGQDCRARSGSQCAVRILCLSLVCVTLDPGHTCRVGTGVLHLACLDAPWPIFPTLDFLVYRV